VHQDAESSRVKGIHSHANFFLFIWYIESFLNTAGYIAKKFTYQKCAYIKSYCHLKLFKVPGFASVRKHPTRGLNKKFVLWYFVLVNYIVFLEKFCQENITSLADNYYLYSSSYFSFYIQTSWKIFLKCFIRSWIKNLLLGIEQICWVVQIRSSAASVMV